MPSPDQIGLTEVAGIQFIKGVMSGPLEIPPGTGATIEGSIDGIITVRSLARLRVLGVVGDLVIELHSFVEVQGTVLGDVLNQGELVIQGVVLGSVYNIEGTVHLATGGSIGELVEGGGRTDD